MSVACLLQEVNCGCGMFAVGSGCGMFAAGMCVLACLLQEVNCGCGMFVTGSKLWMCVCCSVDQSSGVCNYLVCGGVMSGTSSLLTLI